MYRTTTLQHTRFATMTLLTLQACVAAGPLDGQVVDGNGRGIANAVVTLQGTSAASTTDGDGNFIMRMSGPAPYVLRVTADGYARTSARLTDVSPQSTRIFVSAVDTTVALTLPTSGQPDAQVLVTKGNASAQLGIPANSLVTPDGLAASGNVTVSMTYWDGQQGMITAPGPLLAKPTVTGGAPSTLKSVGMADIEIRQGNDILQVASGQTLSFVVTMPGTLKTAMTVASFRKATSLYYLDPNTALWEYVAAIDTPMFQYDDANGILTGRLPHLSSWNYDELGGVSGCLKGRVLDCAGNPLPNQAFLGWEMSFEGLHRAAWTTDPNGNYCESIAVPDLDAVTNGQWSFPIHLSGTDSPSDSSFPNVIPSQCVTCIDSGEDTSYADTCYCGVYNTQGDPFCGLPGTDYTACAWMGQRTAGTVTQESFNYNGVACDKLVTITQGTACPSPQCDTMPDLVIGTCVGGVAVLAPTACTVANPKYIGSECLETKDCCATPASGPLVCADLLCVPASDE